MNKTEANRFNDLYQRHQRLLKLQGKAESTRNSYARAVRRITNHFDCGPDQLTVEQREEYFSKLVDTHSWSTVKVDRNGLQFFWEHILKRDWEWVNIINPPQVRTLPDIHSVSEVEQLIGAIQKLRYQKERWGNVFCKLQER
jgi:integrase/recombinase XerD